MKPLHGIVIGAGALLFIGTFLPWATFSLVVISVSVSGTSSNGALPLVCGLVAIGIGVLLVRGVSAIGWLIGVGVAFLIAMGLTLHDAADLSSLSGQTSNGVSVGAGVSIGIGLVLCILASVAGLVATIVLFVQRRNEGPIVWPFVSQNQPSSFDQAAPEAVPMPTSAPGPGWWQAANGQFYPPESHPDYVMPMPPPSGPTGSPPQ